MRSRKLKVEFYDADGVRHSVTMDGPVTREKLGKLLDLVETMSGAPRTTATALGLSPHKFDRVAGLVVAQMRGREFTASEARTAYEEAYREKIPLSTVSTYLTRLTERGIIERGLERPLLHYHLKAEEPRLALALRQALVSSPLPSAHPSHS